MKKIIVGSIIPLLLLDLTACNNTKAEPSPTPSVSNTQVRKVQPTLPAPTPSDRYTPGVGPSPQAPGGN